MGYHSWEGNCLEILATPSYSEIRRLNYKDVMMIKPNYKTETAITIVLVSTTTNDNERYISVMFCLNDRSTHSIMKISVSLNCLPRIFRMFG